MTYCAAVTWADDDLYQHYNSVYDSPATQTRVEGGNSANRPVQKTESCDMSMVIVALLVSQWYKWYFQNCYRLSINMMALWAYLVSLPPLHTTF